MKMPAFAYRPFFWHCLVAVWFGVLYGLRRAGLAHGKWLALAVTVLFCTLVGVFDEWHQLHVPGRSGGDVGDWLADTLGGVFGTLAVFFAERWFTSAGTTTAAAR